MVPQAIHLLTECLDVLKTAIHRGKTYVSHLIEMPQLFHHPLAYGTRGNLTLAERAQRMADSTDRLLDGFAADGTLLEGTCYSGTQLCLIERRAALVSFDDERHDELRRLEGRKALGTRQTFASAPDLPAFARQSRVDDFSFGVPAERTMHA